MNVWSYRARRKSNGITCPATGRTCPSSGTTSVTSNRLRLPCRVRYALYRSTPFWITWVLPPLLIGCALPCSTHADGCGMTSRTPAAGARARQRTAGSAARTNAAQWRDRCLLRGSEPRTATLSRDKLNVAAAGLTLHDIRRALGTTSQRGAHRPGRRVLRSRRHGALRTRSGHAGGHGPAACSDRERDCTTGGYSMERK